MQTRNLHIAAYDIASPKRLHHALDLLKGFSTGGQKSVFECFLSPNEQRELLIEATHILDLEEDRFLLIAVDAASPVTTRGIAVPPESLNFFYVGDE